jgi:hypothetical protein
MELNTAHKTEERNRAGGEKEEDPRRRKKSYTNLFIYFIYIYPPISQ